VQFEVEIWSKKATTNTVKSNLHVILKDISLLSTDYISCKIVEQCI